MLNNDLWLHVYIRCATSARKRINSAPNPFSCILILTVFFFFLTLVKYIKRSIKGKPIAIYLNLSTYSDNRESENMKVRAFIAAMILQTQYSCRRRNIKG